MRESFSRGLSSGIKRTPNFFTRSAMSGGPKTATAPRFTASAMKFAPSLFTPLSAANRNPGLTSRLSAASPRNSDTSFVTVAADPTCPTLAPDYGSIVKNSRICRGDGVIPGHAQKRSDARNNAPDRGCRRPCAGCEAKACFVAFRFIGHDEDEILRVVNRKDADKGRDKFVAGVRPVVRLFRGASLSAHIVARNVAFNAGSVGDHEPQKVPHRGAGGFGNDADSILWGAIALQEGRPDQGAAINHGGSGGSEAQGIHRNTLAVGDGGAFDLAPTPGIERGGDLRKLGLQGLQESKILKEGFLPRWTRTQRDLRSSDVRGFREHH